MIFRFATSELGPNRGLWGLSLGPGASLGFHFGVDCLVFAS